MSLKLSSLSQGFVLNKPCGNNDPEDLRELQQRKDSQKQIRKKEPKQANYDVYDMSMLPLKAPTEDSVAPCFQSFPHA